MIAPIALIARLSDLIARFTTCRCTDPASGPGRVIGNVWHCGACGRPVAPDPRPTWEELNP
jgi:hypothetical protein